MALNWRKFVDFSGLAGIIITLILLPIDRLPYLDYIPFNLGLISLVLLLIGASGRLADLFVRRDFAALKKYFVVGLLVALPVAGYAVSTTYAIDQVFALSATKFLLAVALRAYCFFVLISERPLLWGIIKKTIYLTTAAVVAFGFFQYIFDTFGASPSITDLRSCCTSNSTYVFPRVHSTALEPLYLDHYLMIPLWLLMFDFWKDKKAQKNKWLAILFLATATLFILTIARSAVGAFLIAGIIFYVGGKKTKDFRPFIKRVVKLWGAAILISVILVLISGLASLFIDKKAQYGAGSGIGSVALFGGHIVDVADGSAKTRYESWPKAIEYVTEEKPPRPIVGVGADNSRIWLNWEGYKQGKSIEKLQPFNNDLLGLIVDLGLISIVTFGPPTAVLVYCLYRLFRSKWAPATAPMALALVGMLIQGNFFHSLLLTRTWVAIGIVLIVLAPTKAALKTKYENNN